MEQEKLAASWNSSIQFCLGTETWTKWLPTIPLAPYKVLQFAGYGDVY